MTQQFYDSYIKEWTKEHHLDNHIYPIYDISMNSRGYWEYLTENWYSESSAKTRAKLLSEESVSNPVLWRVTRGNITIALFLKGEEIVEND